MCPASDEMLTITPRPAASIGRAAAWAHRNGAVRSRSMMRCQSSTASVAESATWPAPALLTSTSSRPNRASARSTSARGAAGSVSSTPTPDARAPNSAAVASARSCEREVTTTLIPRASSSAATARPMPEEDPVTIATRPLMAASAQRRPGLLLEDVDDLVAALAGGRAEDHGELGGLVAEREGAVDDVLVDVDRLAGPELVPVLLQPLLDAPLADPDDLLLVGVAMER